MLLFGKKMSVFSKPRLLRVNALAATMAHVVGTRRRIDRADRSLPRARPLTVARKLAPILAQFRSGTLSRDLPFLVGPRVLRPRR
jgi:hypothetical protein